MGGHQPSFIRVLSQKAGHRKLVQGEHVTQSGDLCSKFATWVGQLQKFCGSRLPWLHVNRETIHVCTWTNPLHMHPHCRSTCCPQTTGLSSTWELVRMVASQVPLQPPPLYTDKICLFMKTPKWFSFSLNLDSTSVVNKQNLPVPQLAEFWYLHCISTFAMVRIALSHHVPDLWLTAAETQRRLTLAPPRRHRLGSRTLSGGLAEVPFQLTSEMSEPTLLSSCLHWRWQPPPSTTPGAFSWNTACLGLFLKLRFLGD